MEFLDTLERYKMTELYQWLNEHQIILNEQSCSYYSTHKTFKTVNSTSDFCVFRCCNNNCTKYEKTKIIRHDSWLSDYKIPIKHVDIYILK